MNLNYGCVSLNKKNDTFQGVKNREDDFKTFSLSNLNRRQRREFKRDFYKRDDVIGLTRDEADYLFDDLMEILNK